MRQARNQSSASKGKKPAGYCNPNLYGGANAFRDISQGNNDMTGKLGKYAAGPGWDACSGLGSPIRDKLLALLG
jgi:kumamolisin